MILLDRETQNAAEDDAVTMVSYQVMKWIGKIVGELGELRHVGVRNWYR